MKTPKNQELLFGRDEEILVGVVRKLDDLNSADFVAVKHLLPKYRRAAICYKEYVIYIGLLTRTTMVREVGRRYSKIFEIDENNKSNLYIER